jgi:PAS domain S-box-containing protein
MFPNRNLPTVDDAILDALPANVALVDREGVIVAVNRKWREFGQTNGLQSDSSLVGANYLQVCAAARGAGADVAKAVGAGIRAVLQGAEADFSIEYPCHSSLEQQWGQLIAAPLQSSGAVTGAVVLHIDITARKLAELAATKHLYTAQVALQAQNAVICENDVRTNVLHWSDRLGPKYGFPADSVLRTREAYLQMTHPDDRDSVRAAVQATAEHGRRLDLHHRVLWPDGRIRWLEMKGHLFRDHEAQSARLVVAMRDITTRREREASLRRLAAIVETSQEAIIGLSPADEIQMWNQGATLTYGYRHDEVIGRSISMLAPLDRHDEALGINQRLNQGKTIQQFETVRIRKDGVAIDISLSAYPIFDADGAIVGTASFSRDITERKRLETQLRQAQKMDAVGRLAGGLAHDFNNLLTVILGCGEVLRDGSAPPDAQREFVGSILDAAERAAALSKQLLTFSRTQPLNPESLNLNDIVEQMQKMLRRVIREDITLVSEFDPQPVMALADRGQIEQVIMNLVVNARDAMPHGGCIRISTLNPGLAVRRTQIGGAPPSRSDQVSLQVTDNGSGIAPEHLSQIFEPFFTTKERGKGTGLGLAMVHGIVKQSEGEVSVTSKLGEGTTFTVCLPRSVPASKATAEYREHQRPRGTGTILLAEDEPDVRSLVKLTLEAHGYQVLSTSDGDEALALLTKCPASVDLLLSDLVMPRMGGRELARMARALKPGIVVLMMSGYAPEEVNAEGPLISDWHFLRKPFAPPQLLDKVREALRPAKDDCCFLLPPGNSHDFAAINLPIPQVR